MTQESDLNKSIYIKRLENGESSEMEVFSKNWWNNSGIKVEKGEEYIIKASGEWQDKKYKSGPSGYKSPNLLMKAFEFSRRHKKARWFSLVACVHPNDSSLEKMTPESGNVASGLVESLKKKIYKIDCKSQISNIGGHAVLKIESYGFLYFFANDTAFSYGNNSGGISAVVTRIL